MCSLTPIFRRSLFGLALPLAALAAEPSPAKPIAPGETNAGLGIVGSGLNYSPDGRWLGFYTNKGAGSIDLQTGKLSNTRKGWSFASPYARMTAWSPLGDTVAFQFYREGKIALALWTPSTDTLREVVTFPRKLYPKMPVTWSPDAKVIYFVINQNLPWERLHPKDDKPTTRSINVTLELSGIYKDTTERERFPKEYEGAYAEGNRSLVMALEVATGKLGLLCKGNDVDSIYLSPDGQHLALVQIKRNSVKDLPSNWSAQNYADIYLVDTAAPASLPFVDLEKLDDRKAGWWNASGQRLNPILTDVPMNGSGDFNPPQSFGSNGNPTLLWSPDNTTLAYATVGRKATGDIYAYDLASKQLRNLTETLSLKKSEKSIGYGENLTHIYDSQKFGFLFNPVWLANSQALVGVGQSDAWLIPIDPKGKPRNLTAKLSQETYRVVCATRPDLAALDEAGRFTLVVRDRVTRTDSVWKVNPSTGDLAKISDLGTLTNLTVLTDKDNRSLVYTAQSIVSSRNVYRLPLTAGAKPEFLTRYRMQLAERLYPKSVVLNWKTPDGYPGYGLLYLPPAASESKKVPLIFEGYPSEDESRLDARAQSGAAFYTDSLHGLLRDGFAVLFADIPMSDTGVYEHPMKQIVDGVRCAADAAIATGVVDETRMGIVGSSYGGVMVNAVISHSQRFKAAVSHAGVSDWTSTYMMKSDLKPGYYHEYGQGRFVKPVWEDAQRYAENSPQVSWNKVQTPVLILHGEDDTRVPIQNAWETYNGSARLNQNAIFAHYPRVGHGRTAEQNQRIRGWFREHLLGGKPVTQIADQGSYFFGGSQDDDEPADSGNPAPTPSSVPPPGPNAPPSNPTPNKP